MTSIGVSHLKTRVTNEFQLIIVTFVRNQCKNRIAKRFGRALSMVPGIVLVLVLVLVEV